MYLVGFIIKKLDDVGLNMPSSPKCYLLFGLAY